LQAKYLKCATDCIISVISDNEGILNNIADSIKINKDASEDQKKDIEVLKFKKKLWQNF